MTRTIFDRASLGEPLTLKEIGVVVRTVDRVCKGQPMADYTNEVRQMIIKGSIPISADRGMREPCGYNFNDTIMSYPFDGTTYEYSCPKCGLKTSFTTPIFQVKNDSRS